MANLPEVPIWAPVYQLEQTDQVLGGLPDRLSGAGKSNWPLQDLGNRTAYLKEALEFLSLTATETVTVGPGGNHATINAALAELSERRPVYQVGGFRTEVRLLNGFTMAEQVIVRGVNLGWIDIIAEAGEVFIDRTYLNTEFQGAYPAFAASFGGYLPGIACQFTMTATGTAAGRHGIFLYGGGGARVGGGAGVRNAGGHGLLMQTGSVCDANGANFSAAGDSGATVMGSSRLTIEGGNLANANNVGLNAVNAANVHAMDALCNGASQYGIRATRGATINARAANARRGAGDSSADISVAEGGWIAAHSSIGGASQALNTITASGIIQK